jgi:hypothetical protein
MMRTITASDFKARFSEALDAARDGETIISLLRTHASAGCCHGGLRRARVPPQERPLGQLRSTARISFGRDFALTNDTLLGS